MVNPGMMRRSHALPKKRARLFIRIVALALLTGCLPAAGAQPVEPPLYSAADTSTSEPTRTAVVINTPVPIPTTAVPTRTAEPAPSQTPTIQTTTAVFSSMPTDVPRVAVVIGKIARCDLSFQDGKYLLGTGCEAIQRMLAVPVGDTIWLKILMTDAHQELPTVLPVEGSVPPKVSWGYLGWQFAQAGEHTVQARIQDTSQGLDAVVEIKINVY